jgi:Flp pilus assembly protein TadD
MVQAMKLLRRALEWEPGRWVVWCDLGRCEAATGQVELARASFHRALELEANCSAAQAGLNALHGIGWWRRLWGGWRKGG